MTQMHPWFLWIDGDTGRSHMWTHGVHVFVCNHRTDHSDIGRETRVLFRTETMRKEADLWWMIGKEFYREICSLERTMADLALKGQTHGC